MTDNNFDYKSFSIKMKSEAFSLIPKDIGIEDNTFICNIIKDFINLAGEELSKDDSYTIEQQQNCCQIIAEWTFYKSVDMIRANLPKEYWEPILQSIAFAIYEVVKQCFDRDIKQEQMLQAVEYHVNKNFKYKLDELYAKNVIDKTLYTEALAKSNIDEMNKEEDHGDCYSLGNRDEEFLNDSVAVAFSKNLAYRYLLKAAHCLKKVSMQANDRQKVLFLLRYAIVSVINHIQTSTFNFSIPQVERIITVSMELLFHRIVVMYKNNILSNNTWSEECVSFFASMIYTIEFCYVKDNDKLKDVYEHTNLLSNKQLKEYLDKYVENNTLTRNQVNKSFDKSYIVYLEKEICKLMKTKQIPNAFRNLLFFFLIYFILKLVIYFFLK